MSEQPTRGPSPSDLRTTLNRASRVQKLIARRMTEAKSGAPEFTVEVEVDLTQALDLRASLRDSAGDRPVPSVNDLVIKACANALVDHPRLNGSFVDDAFHLHGRINVGFAVGAGDSLVVPVIHDADQMSVFDIALQTRQLIDKVRAGRIALEDITGGTFSVSNLGMYGVSRFTAVLNPPQAAILAVGAARRRPAIDDSGRMTTEQVASLNLTADHRIVYGEHAALFLRSMCDLLAAPESLLDPDHR